MQPRVQINDLPAISNVAIGMLTNEGTYGRVYEGVYKGRTVVIKIAKDTAFDSTPEALFLSKLRHPHVVDFIGIARIQNTIALVMRQELKTLLSQISHKISDEQRITYANDIYSAFKYIHALEIIHGDIKTENILITSDDRLRLCDFGLSLLDTGDTDAKGWVARDRIDLGFVVTGQVPPLFLARIGAFKRGGADLLQNKKDYAVWF